MNMRVEEMSIIMNRGRTTPK